LWQAQFLLAVDCVIMICHGVHNDAKCPFETSGHQSISLTLPLKASLTQKTYMSIVRGVSRGVLRVLEHPPHANDN